TRPICRMHSLGQKPTLLVAFELGLQSWKLGFATNFTERPRLRETTGGDGQAVVREIAEAKCALHLPPETPVISCYEAGRDGFWLHRFLRSHGIHNLVGDSASIEVERRARHAKTDRIDVGKLLKLLLRHVAGEPGVWHVVHVPSAADEDARALHSE